MSGFLLDLKTLLNRQTIEKVHPSTCFQKSSRLVASDFSPPTSPTGGALLRPFDLD